MPSVVEWTEPQEQDLGADHLGMRVAGERAYTALVDFTTTVTWRPRYLSFLCWSLRQAWRDLGGGLPAEKVRIDRHQWRSSLKRRDHLIATATLAADPSAERIVGKNRITQGLLEATGNARVQIPIDGEHVDGQGSSLEVYLGILRGLRLVKSFQEFDIPDTRGDILADAFEASLKEEAGVALFSCASVSLGDLQRLGRVCGLSQLPGAAAQSSKVLAERHELRSVICDWRNFAGGTGPSSPRLLSIGLMLELVRTNGHQARLDQFRSAVLLDGFRADGGEIASLVLPPLYGDVRNRWRVYQAHAYAIVALEALLSNVLSYALLQERDGIRHEKMLQDLLQFALQEEPDPERDLWAGWWTSPLSLVLESLEACDRQGRQVDFLEPELHGRILAAARNRITRSQRDAVLLLLLSVVRLRRMMRDLGEESWTGDRDPQRLPPRQLIDHVETAAAQGATVAQYLYRCLCDLVIRQHQRNALRKLAADPRKSTALFALEGGLLMPFGEHRPGTSNPRFENALSFLQDLGYVDEEGVTEDGRQLLADISRGGPQ